MNNGRRYALTTRQKARNFRLDGYTHREIAKEIGCSYSMASVWTRDIVLTPEQEGDIERRRKKPDYIAQKSKWQRFARKNLARFWKKPYSRKELLNKIQTFYSKTGRIPMKREFNMYREYRERFGSWNNAIKEAGFTPNPSLYVKRKFFAKDGHKCDSFSEKIIDDWLFENGIGHQRSISYPNSKMTCDFLVGDFRIEFFGLADVNENYKKLWRQKRLFCKQNKIKLIEIYPEALYKNQKKFFANLLTILRR